ncbi:MAG: DUF6515 family protein [Candidatus Omnitrophota bacterium]
MKRLTRDRILLFVLILSVFCFVQAKDSFAQTPRSHSNRSEGPSFHGSPPRHPYYHRDLPWGCIPLHVADALYYYLEGAYYRETPSGYVIVSAPRGAIITSLPERHRVIVYDSTDYYYYNNAYYVKQPAGYTVVTPPPSVVSSNAPAIEAPEKTIVVTVPNPNGSYIPVTLQKYSDGYVGPNGEFYPDYPTIDQLKAMYAKASAVAERPEPAELTFDIPNKNGSVTKVKVTRTKDGYVGPEGEYYTQKPTIEQLKIMYAKD